MNSLAEQKKQINIVQIIEAAGVELTGRAGRYVGCCPFHDDHSPSFVVYPDQHFKCYGCGIFGDVIDFVQQFNNCDFNQACRHLGIKKGHISRAKIIQLNKKRIEQESRQQRERDLAFTLSALIRWTEKATANIKATHDIEKSAELFHSLPFWKYCHKILSQGEPKERSEVVKALADMKAIKRNMLFKSGFDFKEWLRRTFKEPKIEREKKASSA